MGSPLAPVLANLFMGHHENGIRIWYTSGLLFFNDFQMLCLASNLIVI